MQQASMAPEIAVPSSTMPGTAGPAMLDTAVAAKANSTSSMVVSPGQNSKKSSPESAEADSNPSKHQQVVATSDSVGNDPSTSKPSVIQKSPACKSHHAEIKVTEDPEGTADFSTDDEASKDGGPVPSNVRAKPGSHGDGDDDDDDADVLLGFKRLRALSTVAGAVQEEPLDPSPIANATVEFDHTIDEVTGCTRQELCAASIKLKLTNCSSESRQVTTDIVFSSENGTARIRSKTASLYGTADRFRRLLDELCVEIDLSASKINRYRCYTRGKDKEKEAVLLADIENHVRTGEPLRISKFNESKSAEAEQNAEAAQPSHAVVKKEKTDTPLEAAPAAPSAGTAKVENSALPTPAPAGPDSIASTASRTDSNVGDNNQSNVQGSNSLAHANQATTLGNSTPTANYLGDLEALKASMHGQLIAPNLTQVLSDSKSEPPTKRSRSDPIITHAGKDEKPAVSTNVSLPENSSHPTLARSASSPSASSVGLANSQGPIGTARSAVPAAAVQPSALNPVSAPGTQLPPKGSVSGVQMQQIAQANLQLFQSQLMSKGNITLGQPQAQPQIPTQAHAHAPVSGVAHNVPFNIQHQQQLFMAQLQAMRAKMLAQPSNVPMPVNGMGVPLNIQAAILGGIQAALQGSASPTAGVQGQRLTAVSPMHLQQLMMQAQLQAQSQPVKQQKAASGGKKSGNSNAPMQKVASPKQASSRSSGKGQRSASTKGHVHSPRKKTGTSGPVYIAPQSSEVSAAFLQQLNDLRFQKLEDIPCASDWAKGEDKQKLPLEKHVSKIKVRRFARAKFNNVMKPKSFDLKAFYDYIIDKDRQSGSLQELKTVNGVESCSSSGSTFIGSYEVQIKRHSLKPRSHHMTMDVMLHGERRSVQLEAMGTLKASVIRDITGDDGDGPMHKELEDTRSDLLRFMRCFREDIIVPLGNRAVIQSRG